MDANDLHAGDVDALVRDIFLAFVRVHVLHHAAEGPIYGAAMIEEVGTEPARGRSSLRAPPQGATPGVLDGCHSALVPQAGGAACTGRLHFLSASVMVMRGGS
jgi:hypothetical protein